jgi:cell wall-associated NlpC family hydrolase
MSYRKGSRKIHLDKRFLNKKALVLLTSALFVTASVATVKANQTYDDYSVGISSAFDQYADSVVGESKQKEASAVTESKVDTTSASAKKTKDSDSQASSETEQDKYPEFSGKCIVASTDYANIRSEASVDSEVVGIIESNGIATVVEKGDEWTKVTSGQCQGYIRNDLLLYGDEAGSYADSNLAKNAVVSAETLNVRAEADVDSDCLTLVGQGQSFEVLSEDDDWVEISLPEGYAGYVSAEYVEFSYDLPEAKTIEQIEEEQRAEEEAEKAKQEEAAKQEESQNSQDTTDQSQDTTQQSQTATQESQPTTEAVTETTTEATTESVAAPSGQTGIDLANYATQFVGNPYVYGGSSLTDGADCSGFVMAVYAQFGYSLPHSAGAQSGYGTRVDTSSLEPGDIVFYGNDGVIGHCGIYIGGGNIVHASTEATGIKISNYLYRTPMCAVRLIGQ